MRAVRCRRKREPMSPISRACWELKLAFNRSRGEFRWIASPLGMSVRPSVRYTFTPAGTTIMMLPPLRRAAASPQPKCCRPAQRRAVHRPARSQSCRRTAAPDRARQQPLADHRPRRRRASPSQAAVPCQAELDPLNTMLGATPWRWQTCTTLTPGFSVYCTAEPTPIRLPVHRFRRQAASASRAVSSAAYLSPGTRTKQHSPVHLVAGVFETIAPDPQRMGGRPSAAANLACPMPLQFIASTCMLQNARSAIGSQFVRTL
ncbi:hypothetical protein ACVIYL_004863 [Bradyrhizobium sp. USDA 3315]